VLETPRVARVERLAESGITVKVLGSVAPALRYEAAGALRRMIVEEAAARGVIIGWRSVPADESADADPSAASRQGLPRDDPPPPPLTTNQ
jgi:hypothetical protein